MAGVHVEYLGFRTEGASREYALRVTQPGGEFRDFTLAIALEAFVAHRARYQDAPEICFLKLSRELAAGAGGPLASRFEVSDAELADYRTAHTPKPPQRRTPPPH